jgi:preprotein translocase subunit YajC
VGQILILVAMFALLWFVLIRPQKAKQRAQQERLSNIEPGDEVLTVGGLFGIVQSIDEDDELIVEIAEGIHVRIARKAVATVVKPELDDADEAEVTEAESDDESETAGESTTEAEHTTKTPVA